MSAAIRTGRGPVDLRERRKPTSISVEGLGSGLTVGKGWLKLSGSEVVYRRAVMQAMLYASQRMKLFDSDDPFTLITPEEIRAAEARRENLLTGKEKPVVSADKKRSLKKVERLQNRDRDLLIKFSNKCSISTLNRRERYFVVENGEILVYRSNAINAKCKQAYSLKDAMVFQESRRSAPYPIWEQGFDVRLRVDTKERNLQHKAPVYLYATPDKIQRWKRAFSLAKCLINENDRRALKTAIGRATSASLVKGWDALIYYYKEFKTTKELMRSVGMRLVKVELSRGYTKMRLLYRAHIENERRRRDQRLWAARFVSERMTRISGQKAKSYSDMRESVISIIQQKFRRFRNDGIFDRTYPVASGFVSSFQQAKIGKPLDVCISSLSGPDVMRLTVEPELLKTYGDYEEIFKTRKPCYSEVNLPTCTMHVHLTDNLSSLSFSSTVPESNQDATDYTALAKADWSKFIHVDRIHSIVMNSEPLVGASLRGKDKKPDQGVWFTVNGPRLSWSKRLNPADPERRSQGAADGLEVPEKLSQSKVTPWAQVRVAIGDALLKISGEPPASRNGRLRKTYIHAHILGYAFRSEDRHINGESVDYNFFFEAALPLAADENAVATLASSELAVEVFEIENGVQRLLLVGSTKLPKVFGADDQRFQEAFSRDGNIRMGLRPPFSAIDDRKCEAGVSISVRTEVGPVPSAVPHFLGDKLPLSPEFAGLGMMTSLYTSHRSVWYNPRLGISKFQTDHVANFVELSIASLRFPKEDTGCEGRRYKIKACIGPASGETPYLTRPKEGWSKLLGPQSDVKAIKFDGHVICLPLPPGCWGEDVPENRRRVSVQVWMLDGEPCQSCTFHECVASAGRVRPKFREVMVYQANVYFDNVMVDVQKNVSIAMGKKKPCEVDMFTNITRGEATECSVNADIALRDRDYVKGVIGQPRKKRALCVGDQATLFVEEILNYPTTAQDFRRRFFEGSWDAKKAEKAGQNNGEWPGGRGCPLRMPCLSSEYVHSQLAYAVPPRSFKTGFIPTLCHDVSPHQFVLPLTEAQFLKEGHPGDFGKIVDDLVTNPPKAPKGTLPTRAPAPNYKHVVTHLKTSSRPVAVTLLATYADGTCDVELSSEFMNEWSKSPGRKFNMPGQLALDPGPGAPKGPARTAPDPANMKNARALVKRLPSFYLRPVHGGSFHIYDAMYHTTADVLSAPRPEPGFDPRLMGRKGALPEDFVAQTGGRTVAAGPLPPDASCAACEYEWSVRMRASSPSEMYAFVSMLRRCARVENHQQASKMRECQRECTKMAETAAAQTANTARPMHGGQLDVLLVEARRLLPTKDFMGNGWKPAAELLDRPELKLNEAYLPKLNGTTSGEMAKVTPEGNDFVSIYVNMRMLSGKDIIPFRGQKKQVSPMLSGTDSPVWAAAPELKNKGGHLFHTGHIDPDKYPELILDFEVMQYGPVPGVYRRIGAIQLPVTQRQFLTNPREPFKNFWLPLVSLKDGTPIPNPTGEIHVMTRWLPADKILTGPQANTQQVSVRSAFLKEIWPRIIAPRLREPVYSLEVHYLHYNPNLVRDSMSLPETPKDHQRRHAEELANALPYLAALERRQTSAWDEFEAQLGEMAGVRLGEMRLKWLEENQESRLAELHALVFAGIPSARRAKIWSEITLASRVMERDGVAGFTGHESRRAPGSGERARKAAEAEYQMLLEKGLPLRSDAAMQLAEDCFNLSAWETSVPPVAEFEDLHLKRLRMAQNVCTALIACPQGAVSYCESLLILAFFLLLPQGCREDRSLSGNMLHYMSESQVFWLLYTLICSRVNGTYSEYYGSRANQPPGSGGAVADVDLLECCIAYYEPKVWQHLNAVGFQLSSVFYGAFMRLFATYMPTSSVFRLWDILFDQSTDPKAQPHARVSLIDFAFGVVRTKRVDLLQCESAQEVKHLLLGCLGTMYDMSTVTDIISMADTYLWGGAGFSSSKIAYLWTQRENAFQGVNAVASQQNEVVRHLTQVQPLKFIPATKYESPMGQAGVTTRELLKDVLPVLNNSLENAKAGRGPGKYWYMHRPMPLTAKMLNEGLLEQTRTMVFNSIRLKPIRPSLPFLVSPLPSRDGRVPMGVEPFGVTEPEFIRVIHQDIPSWHPKAAELWKTFVDTRADAIQDVENYGGRAMHDQVVDPTQIQASQSLFVKLAYRLFNDIDPPLTQRSKEFTAPQVSINELFISLVCFSRGTVGEKASALFNIYSSGEPGYTASLHRLPVTKLAKSCARAADTTGAMEKNLTVPDPDSESAKNNALRFTIYSNYPRKRTRVGDVYVPMLGPYINYGSHEPDAQHFNIWGELQSVQDHPKGSEVAQLQTMEKKIVCIGDIEMALAWAPRSVREPEVGQLMVHMKAIKFYKMYVSDYYKINPWVELCSFNAGKPVEIPRWEPRGVMARDGQQSWLTTHGAYGGTMFFEQTMKDVVLKSQGDMFMRHLRDGKQGWDPKTESWTWNEVWGKQYSTETFRMQKDFVALSQRKNVMDMQGVRMIVQCILRRGLYNFTNRQMLLIADEAFNRQGAVPGIIEAILVHGAEIGVPANSTLLEVKAYCNENKIAFFDVTNEVSLEHERQVAKNGGYLNLFMDTYMEKTQIELKTDMGIPHFPYSSKVLWLRYVRGGDGERRTQSISIGRDGLIPKGSEVPIEVRDLWPQTKVTKEEFVSCLLASPILSESIRHMAGAIPTPVARRALNLDVTLLDPTGESQEYEVMDNFSLGQSLLLEVWDSDGLQGRDFLGEVWLPPLATLGPRMRDLVLPLQPADFSKDAENGPTRHDEKKKLDPSKVVTGDIFVSVGWKYPAYEVDTKDDKHEEAGESLHHRALVQEKLHTGKLTIHIKKATRVRRADASKGLNSDPQATLHLRNDHVGAWRKKFLLRTKIANNTLNPVWDFQGEVDISTGEYESRLPAVEQPDFFTEMANKLSWGYKKDRRQEARDLASLQRSRPTTQGGGPMPALEIKFGSNELAVSPSSAPGGSKPTPGANHQVTVHLGDTVREFRTKLTEACKKEADFWLRTEGEDSGTAARYKDVTIGYDHVVMVFVPSATVQRLSAQRLHEGEEYARAYATAVADPSSWQPLDPARSFWQYAEFGFGKNQAWSHMIRVAQGTETYKHNNLRYKEYARELNVKGYDERDTKEEAFGWAQYIHANDRQGDQPTVEWRPCFVSNVPKPQQPTAALPSGPTANNYMVKWCFPPAEETPGASAFGHKNREIRERRSVLLRPRAPQFDDEVHPLHVELLEQALMLRKSGKSDFDIELLLRKPLEDAWEAQRDASLASGDQVEIQKPPPLTVDIIRSYLNRTSLEASSKRPF